VRRTKPITISEPGRDEGKTFILTEMPAEQAEVWAMTALDLLRQVGFIGTEGNGGMAELAKARPLTLEAARALQNASLDEMWQYVQFQPKKEGAPPQKLFRGDDCQIQEWRTRLALRVAFLALHTDFFSPENPSALGHHSAHPSSS
jgi:hypothetical protein